jgi:TRAP-type C4-dicarboxylate transport system substrate-binding protein
VISKTAFAALPPQYQELIMGLKDEVTQVMIDRYVEADSKNLPEFEKTMTKIVYDDATLQQFADVAGKPVWQKWIDDNKDKFDSQNVFDTMWELIKEAQAK